ncbi:hypothetical protein AB4Y64_11055 [Lysobacter sp. TAF61]|uniref:hypothetical protein n=1 Tax=Lysobacter sp. TAF61 TaxID=3233072 RepID=UPI003F97736C
MFSAPMAMGSGNGSTTLPPVWPPPVEPPVLPVLSPPPSPPLEPPLPPPDASTSPMRPPSRLLTLVALKSRPCRPVCSIAPSRFFSAAVSIWMRCALSVPPLLSSASVVRIAASRPALISPALVTPPVASTRVLVCACSLPVFCR